ncbi:YgfZ/GcvT domain-containing protein [Pusillimonas sp.]|uniref:CAF17-like 4Fe-4S cluster assembly/insertion protein YgfZ n=1 Tax=Pusillimonas sp. TaxID=3040095 RepID=UPI0037C6AE7D
MNNSSAFSAPLTDLAVVRASGADAADFLHGQFTQDITGLPPGQAHLAAYCTAKGRLLATLIILRDPKQADDLIILVKADVAPALVKRLTMFVLRAKVKLEISPASVLGVSLPTHPAGAGVASLTPPDPAAAWSVVQTDQGIWISAPSANEDIQRWWLVTQAGAPSPDDATGMLAAWQAADIAAGLPWIESATQDVFIPQTLNLDLINGVNFTKGCYPGQEVVARSHYRGTVKRRMAYGVADSAAEAALLAGTDIYDTERPESPGGRIVNAAAHDGRTHMLLEVHLADIGAAQYRLGSIDGPHIALHPLPYHIDNSGEA